MSLFIEQSVPGFLGARTMPVLLHRRRLVDCSNTSPSLPVSYPPQATTIRQTAMIKLILFPLMLAWILLERVAILLLTVHDQLILLRPTVTLVCGDLRESGLISLPTEVLYAIVKELECLSLHTTQTSGSPHHVLALSQ